MLEILSQQGVGDIGTTLLATTNADIPNNDDDPDAWWITVVMTGGPGPGYIQNQHPPAYEFPTAQFTSRSKNPVIAETKAWEALRAITTFFEGVNPRNRVVVSGGDRYLRLIPMQSQPFDIGPDEPGRTRYVFNVMADKVPS